MGTLGIQEMIVIFVIALVLFGPKKLPELGRTIGKAITEFRRASNDLKATFEREMQTLERESQSIGQVAQVTASDIFNRAVNYDPEPEVRSKARSGVASPSVRRQKRLTLARMSSADLTQRKGFGSALVALMKARMSRSRSATERWTPRRSARSVKRPNQRSTWLIQDAEVGVKWTW